MAKTLSKQNIGADQVDGTKILLLNTDPLRALNASASPVNLFNFSAADTIQFTQTTDFNSQVVTGLPTAVNPSDAISFAQAQSLVTGLSWKTVVSTASSSPLPSFTYSSGVITATANGALPTINGFAPVLNARYLINGETGGNAPYNGLYTLTQVGVVAVSPFVLTRSTDANTAALLQSSAVSVAVGSTLAGNVYFEDLAIATLGTSDVGFIQINAGMSYTFQNGVVNVAGTVSGVVDPAGALSVGVAGFAAVVDTTTIQIATDALHGAFVATEYLTLNGTDITNKYKDLAAPLSSVGAQGNVTLAVITGMEQEYTVDFSAAATGGSGGVCRINWSGLGLDGFLVSGNEIRVSYSRF